MQATSVGYRLSPLQERAWKISQRHGQRAYSAAAFIMDAAPDPARLRAALDALAGEFELLRTRIEQVPGMRDGIQYVDDDSRGVFAVTATVEDAATSLQTLVDRHLSAPQADAANLAVAALMPAAPGPATLLLRAPATIADARSLRLLAQRLMALCAGVADAAQDEVSQYIDIAEWMRDVLESDDTATGREHWPREVMPETLRLALPFERVADDARTGIARLRCVPDAAAVAAWERCAADSAQPLQAIALAAWHRSLSPWLGDRDVTIAVEYDGRNYDELRDVVGPMARHLPIRLPAAAGSDAQCVARAADALDIAGRYQEYFDWSRAVGEQARSAVSFGFACRDLAASGGAHDTARGRLLDEWGSEEFFSMRLILRRLDGAMCVDIDYDPARCAPVDAACLQRQFLQAMDAFAARSAGAGSDGIPSSVPESAIEGSAIDGLAMAGASIAGITAGALFQAQARQRPDAIALRSERGAIDYGTLNRAVNRIAHRLLHAGVRVGDAVAICMERDETSVAAFLAALKIGAAYLPLDIELPAERLCGMVEDAAPRLVLVATGQEARFAGARATVLALDAIDASSDVDATADGARDPDIAFDPEHTAYVIFTSGSTGRPKGVAVSHRALCNYVAAIDARLALPAQAEWCAFSTFAADLGYTALYGALCTGRSFQLISRAAALDGPALATALTARPIDCLKIVPSHLSALLRSGAGAALLPRRCLVLGGEAATAELIGEVRALAPQLRIVNHYGPTETTIGVTSFELEGAAYRGGLPVGHAFPGLRLHVMGEQWRACALGEPGELYIAGAGLAHGYLARPDLTAERFLPEPGNAGGARMYRTGDLVRRWPNGAIEWLARADDQVKIRGYRVEPGEIAAVIRRIAGVADACVVSVRDPAGAWLAAYVVAPGYGDFQRDALREELRRVLPEYMVPAAVEWMDALPLNANGKVDRAALPKADRSAARRAAMVPPSTPIEREIAAIWCELLNVEQIGIGDNFFDHGGHSLLLVQMKSRLDARYARTISVVELFQNTTIEKLAAYYGGGDDAGAAGAAQQQSERRASRAEQAKAALMRQQRQKTS